MIIINEEIFTLKNERKNKTLNPEQGLLLIISGSPSDRENLKLICEKLLKQFSFWNKIQI